MVAPEAFMARSQATVICPAFMVRAVPIEATVDEEMRFADRRLGFRKQLRTGRRRAGGRDHRSTELLSVLRPS
jgi:hypothetical protein